MLSPVPGIKMRLFHFALLAIVPGYVPAGNLIGAEVPPYPGDLKEIVGSCVGGPPRTPDICDYSVGIFGDTKETPRYLYAGKFLRYDDKGNPYWLIIDAMPYPKLPKGYEIAISTCSQSGVDDPMIVAVVKTVDEEVHTDVWKAYRLDLKRQKFVSLETKGIECLNEGWGV